MRAPLVIWEAPVDAIEVISRLRQALRRLVPSSHAAGGSLPVRLRSTSFALCGAATAVGLGLVALVANQAWPGAFDNAIPAIPKAAVQSARIAAGPSGGGGGASRPGAAPARVSARSISSGSSAAPDSPSGLGRHPAVSSPGPVSSPATGPAGGHGGVGTPGAAPAGEPPAAAPQPAPVPAPTPAPTPAPVSSPAPTPTEQPPAEDSSAGHGKAKGHVKHESSSAESSPPVKEKHSHGPPPPPETPIADPAPPAEPESPAPPAVPPGHAKTSTPGQGHGHHK